MTAITDEQVSEALASQLHDEWRAPRKKDDGTYDPRPKATTDAAWSGLHGTDQCDIANAAYADLPSDWQAENKASAEDAVRFCGGELEAAAAELHAGWMSRNPKNDWNAAQHVPFAELPEEEKEKDRRIIRTARELRASAHVAETFKG